MKEYLIFMLTFFPLIMLGQELKCCNTEKEVEIYLDGNWEAKVDEPAALYQYDFKNGEGFFRVFKKEENDSLERANDAQPTIDIVKTQNGFQIEYSYKFGITALGIKYLDSEKLVLVRDDGKEKEFYKVSK